MNWERRKKSEEWTKTKADEFVKKENDLTFAEWCYNKGRVEERAKIFEEMKEEYEYLLNSGMGKKKLLNHLINVADKNINPTNNKEQKNG